MKLFFLLYLTLAAASDISAQTPRIEFGTNGLNPEGTVYDSAGARFFVSSATTGTIGTVNAEGQYALFYRDDSLKSTFGMKIDAANHRLWVCAGDPNYSIFQSPQTFRHQIRLIALDLATAKKTADVDLSGLFEGPHFANDLALDDKGNAYVTDSYSPVIYKVDVKGKAAIFSTNDLYKGQGIGLNGIAAKKGILLVVNGSSGKLLRVSLTNPSLVTVVACPFFLNGGDGLLFAGNDLLVAQNKGINKITRLTTADDWRTARKLSSTGGEDRFANPSTLTRSGKKFYALNSKLNELSDTTLPRSQSFSLQEIILK